MIFLNYRWDYPWTSKLFGTEDAFVSSANFREVTASDCEQYLGCGFPITSVRSHVALKNKWVNSGIFQADKPMDHEVRFVTQLTIFLSHPDSISFTNFDSG